MTWRHHHPPNLLPDGESIGPLPPKLRQGLIAITVLALISFISSTVLFLYLTYKLVVWRFFVRPSRSRRPSEQPQPRPRQASQQTTDFTLGIDGIFSESDLARQPSETSAAADNGHAKPIGQPDLPSRARKRPPPNQFLVLIYNLLLADMHQSLAFLLNASWLRRDAIMVHTSTCFSQGFFVSTGDLSSSMFITTIAVHTYLSVVCRRRPSQRLLYLIIVANWVFVYLISTLPIAATRNGYNHGGFFVRAGAWCWINDDYENLRLGTHYLFIFIALATTSALYIAIFISLRKQQSRAREAGTDTQMPLHHKPAFLIYPVIYVACTLPLAVGRIVSMSGRHVPVGYFCFAGAMIAFNGSFDCLLFGTTRNVIIFGSSADIDTDDTGLKTFAFLQTPSTRQYGNMVWIQGGNDRPPKRGDETAGGWWSWRRLGGGSRDNWPSAAEPRNTSQVSLRGTAIQMDMVTSVVVEVEKNRDVRYPDTAASAGTSVKSAERDFSDG